MTKDVVGAFLEPLLVAGSEECVQQDVIGFEGAVGFEFAAPVAVFVLLGQKPVAGAVYGNGHTAGEVVNLSEAKLWARRRCRGGFFHIKHSALSIRHSANALSTKC